MARGLKFRTWKVEGLSYLCNEKVLISCAVVQNDNVINTNEQVSDIQNGIQKEVLGLM